MLNRYLDLKPEVAQAVAGGKPVVALESTIISHGMPHPQNVQTAMEVENTIRIHGAVPATIAILGGKLKAGLSQKEMDYLGQSGERVTKVSRRDIPFIVASKQDGATTVAATMIVAAMAGIRIFATGGIGGVHRGAQETFDISADLKELATTDVAVFCAGAKSILDIGLTLEYLETNGIPVIGYGTEEMPAFYTRRSGFQVDHRIDTAMELARTLKTKWDLGLQGGVVVANPVPAADAMDETIINQAIDQAILEMKAQGIKGKATTPFLLARVADLTKGESLVSNIRLVINNAKIAAQTAVHLSKLGE
jgi:pseudouridine-5'-phosphate glycosidase